MASGRAALDREVNIDYACIPVRIRNHEPSTINRYNRRISDAKNRREKRRNEQDKRHDKLDAATRDRMLGNRRVGFARRHGGERRAVIGGRAPPRRAVSRGGQWEGSSPLHVARPRVHPRRVARGSWLVARSSRQSLSQSVSHSVGPRCAMRWDR